MRPFWTGALILTPICAAFAIAQNSPVLREKRQGASDLDLSGELLGLPPESTRLVTRDKLLAMPQVNLTITGDPNFSRPTKVRGVKLEDLVRHLAASSGSAMVSPSVMTAIAQTIPLITSWRIIPCWSSR